MRIGEAAERAGVTAKAVRYYEAMGLITSDRRANGYRDYDDHDVRLIREIRALADLGIKAEDTRPFLDCLVSGNQLGDDCPASLDTYRSAIADMTTRIGELIERRDALAALLERADHRTAPLCELTTHLTEIP